MNKPIRICIDCAKDQYLKRFIERNGSEGSECSICGRNGRKNSVPIDDRSKIKDLLKALIRYYYSEWNYNSHFGGDSIESLLLNKNPIIFKIRVRKPKKNEDSIIYDFVDSFSWPPYADDPHKEVSLYYGFDESGRGLWMYPIPDRKSHYLEALSENLKKRNYFKYEKRALKLFRPFKKLFTAKIPKSSVFYRARIGIKQQKWKFMDDFDESEPIVFPYIKDSIGAPPPYLANEGRLNRKGISYLYLSNNIDTSICEIRPHPSHLVSCGSFQTKSDLIVADLHELDFYDYFGSDNLISIFVILNNLNVFFSMPIIPEEGEKYIITQFFTEVFRKLGFNGISYKSSITDGINYCFFDEQKLKYVENSGKVKRVTLVNYKIVDERYEIEEEIKDNVHYYP